MMAPQSLSIQNPAFSALYATASVRNALTGREGRQTVWVYVNDQNGQPVAGARVTLIAHFGSGKETIPIGPTDKDGHTETDFTLLNVTPGQLVILKAEVSSSGQNAEARTFFLAWW